MIKDSDPISVTLTVGQWNQLMPYLGKLPFEAVAVLFRAIDAAADRANGGAVAPMPAGNNREMRDVPDRQ